ncbi:Mfa1 family fimbria major subunit [Bacteroides sp. 519]|uniref:Mfa1 family fimbria major subunit n=1 Tax=Bacteroides sp. 519 TaxID=2302937 RepID=UPI0013D5211C|nr:Mfa1 family fimbria major subunit [Bacteroides sp. 519]
MKMNFKYAMMAFATISMMGLASCSDDPNVDTVVPDEEGLPTLMKITLVDSSDRSATRAYSDYPAMDEEKHINNAIVYMFNSTRSFVKAIDLELGKVTVVENNTPVQKDVWTATFEASSGLHYFIATANAPALEVKKGTGLDNLAMRIDDIKTQFGALTNLGVKDNTGAFTINPNFFMTTTVNVENVISSENYKQMNYVPATLVASTKEEIENAIVPSKNLIQIPIGRAMSKVNLSIPNSVKVGTPYTKVTQEVKSDKYGVIGEVDILNSKYYVANNPTKMYHFPYFGTTQMFQTPLFDQFPIGTTAVGYWPKLHLEAEAGKTVHDAFDAEATKTPAFEATTDKADISATAFYAVENSNLENTWSNTTILQLKTVFTPADIQVEVEPGVKHHIIVSGVTAEWKSTTDGKGVTTWATNVTAATHGALTDNNFYRVWDPNLKAFWPYFFADKASAQALAAKIGDPATGTTYPEADLLVEYNKGICYYMIPIRDKSRGVPECHDATRNHFYDIQIGAFTDCGYNKPGGGDGPGDETDPTDPLYPNDYFVKVYIQVMDWTHVKTTEDTGIGYK